MNGEPADVATTPFDLAGVQAGSHRKSEPLGRGHDGMSATYGARWAIKGGEEPVAGLLYDLPPITVDLCTRTRVMRVEHPAPAPVAESCGVSRRVDDVREQHGGKYAVDVSHGRPLSGQELFDNVDERVLLLGVPATPTPRHLDIARAPNVISSPANEGW